MTSPNEAIARLDGMALEMGATIADRAYIELCGHADLAHASFDRVLDAVLEDMCGQIHAMAKQMLPAGDVQAIGSRIAGFATDAFVSRWDDIVASGSGGKA